MRKIVFGVFVVVLLITGFLLFQLSQSEQTDIEAVPFTVESRIPGIELSIKNDNNFAYLFDRLRLADINRIDTKVDETPKRIFVNGIDKVKFVLTPKEQLGYREYLNKGRTDERVFRSIGLKYGSNSKALTIYLHLDEPFKMQEDGFEEYQDMELAINEGFLYGMYLATFHNFGDPNEEFYPFTKKYRNIKKDLVEDNRRFIKVQTK